MRDQLKRSIATGRLNNLKLRVSVPGWPEKTCPKNPVGKKGTGNMLTQAHNMPIQAQNMPNQAQNVPNQAQNMPSQAQNMPIQAQNTPNQRICTSKQHGHLTNHQIASYKMDLCRSFSR